MHESSTPVRACRFALAIPLTMLLLVVMLGHATPVEAQSLPWPSEHALIHDTNDAQRATLIYATPEPRLVTRDDLLSPELRDYYTEEIDDIIDGGFDLNFLAWAQESSLEPGSDWRWAGCDQPLPARDLAAPCPWDQVGFFRIRDVVDGPLTMLHHDGAYIGLACGNFSPEGRSGPVPTISGVKYEDMDATGRRDAGDPGVKDVEIELVYRGAVIATETTDDDGAYRFELDAEDLTGPDGEPIRPGTYEVRERLQPGWVATETPDPIEVRAESGGLHHRADFGNYRPAMIDGRKFHDTDVDGDGDGAPGIADWTIHLNGDETTTDEDGEYRFEGLAPGTYTLEEEIRDGWRQTAPAPPGVHDVRVRSGDVVSGRDFGNVCLADLDVRLTDMSAGGGDVQADVRIEEVEVPGILDNDPPLPRTSSGAFSGLLPGTYRVTAFLPDEVGTTDPDVTLVDGRFAVVKEITLEACDDQSIELPVFSESGEGMVTGGARMHVPDGWATSGFEFMVRRGEPRGSLQFQDHALGLNLHTREVDLIEVVGDEAWIWGRWHDGVAEQRYLLYVRDNGEPGRDDVFELLVTPNYAVGLDQSIWDSNIQVHHHPGASDRGR